MLKIRKEKEEVIVSIYQVKRINTFFTERIGSELKKLVSNKGKKVCLNLSGIKFIDTDGFRMLAEVNKLAVASGSELYLCNVGRDVKELFELMDLSREFRFESRKFGKEKIAFDVDQLYFTLK